MCMLHTIVLQFKRMLAKEPGSYTLDKWIRILLGGEGVMILSIFFVADDDGSG